MLKITNEIIEQACHHLAQTDPDLASIFHRLGTPPLWDREPGFPTLVYIILEQQVSLASAKAAFERLCAVTDPLTPESLLELDDEAMRAVGFSRQKARYSRGLAEAILAGTFDPEALPSLADEEVRMRLVSLKGIGQWTADVYLLMVLRRPDIWPIGDRALVVAVREVKGLEADPSPEKMEELGEAWRPWRSVAARLLWHHYLNTPRQK